MKLTYAIVSVTNNGSLLAGKIALWLSGEVQVYAKDGRNLDPEAEVYSDLSALVQELFPKVDGIIFIMATGIVVRTISPLLVHKSKDPAIIVMDEKGQHVISLLSGHIGGANRLATEIAEIVEGTPVITTATDVQKKTAPDMVAVNLELEIESFEAAKELASLTVNGKKVLYFVDETLPDVELYRKRAQEMSVTLLEMSQMNQMEYDGAVVITDHRIIHTTPVLFLRPPALVAGIGCRRGTNGQKILKALRQVMAEEGRSLRSLQRLASVDVKEDEIGLLSVADQLELPISFYSRDELELPIREFNLVESEFVKKQIGVGNVCEAAAILASNQGELIVKRKDFEGITIALARVRF